MTFQPENEIGVIVAFVQVAQEAGFEILSINNEFPDATIKRGNAVYQVEFEYRSSSFKYHGHDPRECDLVICWECDGDCGGLPVLQLSDPHWFEQPIALASKDVKEITYWRWRAEKAETQLRQARSQIDLLRPTVENGERWDFATFCEQVLDLDNISPLRRREIARLAEVHPRTISRWQERAKEIANHESGAI